MAATTVRFREGHRVTVHDPQDPRHGQTGEVVDWYFGMTGAPVMLVRLDGEDRPLRFTQTQLEEADYVVA